MNEEISGLSLWMKEVRVFLEAEDAALGDLDTLDAQLKESNALQVRKGIIENQSCRNPGMLDPSCPDRGHICRQFPLYVLIVCKFGEIFCEYDKIVCKYGFCLEL